MQKSFGERKDAFGLVGIDPGADQKAVQKRIDALFKAKFPEGDVKTAQQFIDDQTAQINQVLALIYALLSLAVIISLFGIVNTLVLSISERTREIGMLRAVGTSRRQVRKIVRWEAVITALIGGIIGCVVGLGLSVLFIQPLDGFKLSIPVGQLIVLVVLAARRRRAGGGLAGAARGQARRAGGAGVRVSRTFLIGGGRDPEGVAASHRPFAEAAGGGPIACLVADEGDGVDAARWSDGAAQRRRGRGAGRRAVGRPPGARGGRRPARPRVYVAGGLTPLYRRLLVDDAEPGWLPDGRAVRRLLGGRGGGGGAARSSAAGGSATSRSAPRRRPRISTRSSRSRDSALVPFAVDVHATAWGTLTRLVHAVAGGLVAEGWAIDEHTCLAVDGRRRVGARRRLRVPRDARRRRACGVEVVRA